MKSKFGRSAILVSMTGAALGCGVDGSWLTPLGFGCTEQHVMSDIPVGDRCLIVPQAPVERPSGIAILESATGKRRVSEIFHEIGHSIGLSLSDR
jgi:hypothetical protein